jgi:hypothetical protein
MLTYYLDESGHSGDLASNTGSNFDFEGQPYFALAAVGISSLLPVEEGIERLRTKHKIATGELKSKALQSKSAFVSDVINLLIERKCPLFVEVVDKRFFLCVEIVNCILLPPSLGFDGSAQMWRMRNLLVDWLYDCVTEQVLNQFVEACRTPADQTLLSVLGGLLRLAFSEVRKESAPGFAVALKQMVEATMLAYGQLREKSSDAFLTFLPVPDDSKNARKIWMLPNLSSLTNLYARLNLFHKRKLAGITLVHDQQLQLDEILRRAKFAAEQLQDDAFTPYSDYKFTETAGLEFSASERNIGIQCADILAGTVMRYFRDKSKGLSVSPEVERLMMKLLAGIDANTSFGILQVVPTRMVLRGE